MKYKVGDRVRVQSLDWYEKNKNKFGNVPLGQFSFNFCNTHLCGAILTIKKVQHDYYLVEENSAYWTDEMIEEAVEPELTATTIMDGSIFLDKWFKTNQEIVCPEDYEFFDEMGNIIKTQRVFIRKKKKEYPKTYEECRDYIESCYDEPFCADLIATGYKSKLIESFARLLICRDAYWKIAGEEMGLGKLSWIPDWMCLDPLYVILYQFHDICKAVVNGGTSCILAFPTAEMRDAFKENFKELIEQCKELL